MDEYRSDLFVHRHELVPPIRIEHPVTGCKEQEAGNGANDDKQHPSHGRGIPHLHEGKAFDIQIQRIEKRRVDRSARTIANNERFGERLERLNQRYSQIEEDDGREQRHRNARELAEDTCSVNGRCLVQIVRDLLQTR
ncbi:hypothetical protein D3C84_800390 [compost metagenome]